MTRGWWKRANRCPQRRAAANRRNKNRIKEPKSALDMRLRPRDSDAALGEGFAIGAHVRAWIRKSVAGGRRLGGFGWSEKLLTFVNHVLHYHNVNQDTID